MKRERLIASKSGMALILVVMVLSAMLVLGTIFMQATRLDLKAAAQYARNGQAEVFALEAIHRAASELMYDVWGVNEKRAFACSAEWGQLSETISVSGVKMPAAYAYHSNQGDEPVVSSRSLWRRTNTEFIGSGGPVQTDYRWIDRESLKNPYPTQSGAYYWDEFLPEFTDNYDCFEAGLMLNHGVFTDRNYCNDAKGWGGLWSSGGIYGNWYFPAAGAGDVPPWDYIDTRIVPDSFYHVFRFDLIAADDHKVHCTGVRNSDPKQPIYKYRKDPDFRASHLGHAKAWPDTWGGALNINQVNNNYNWEVYYNLHAAEGVPEQTPFHFPEAKWINVYSPDASRIVGRYAVTVWPDCGTPNPNYMHDGRGKVFMYNEFHVLMADMAMYFQALDVGWTPHGYAQWIYPRWITKTNRIPSTKVVDPPSGSDWSYKIQTRFAQHVDKAGLISGRSELNMLIRKWGFDPGEVTPDELEAEATLIAASTAPSSYEYLLGPHWDQDRLIIDHHKNGVYDTLAARRTFAAYLQNMEYYWGPDERTGEGDEYAKVRFRDFDKDHFRWTPYHELQPNSIDPVDEWDARARTAKARFIVFAAKGGKGTTSWNRCHINPQTLDLASNLPLYQLSPNKWIGSAPAQMYQPEVKNTQVNEVGLYKPSFPSSDFDGSRDYYFVELTAAWGDAHYEYDYSLNGLGLLLGTDGSGYVDVLANADTRIVGREKATGAVKAMKPSDKWRVAVHTWGYSAESAARRNPHNYAVVYFPKDLLYNTANELVVTYNGAVFHRVRLPGAIGELESGQSYSVIDRFNGEDANCWQKVEATPAWRKHSSGQLWHGQNLNWYPRFFPANRVDINNTAKLGDMSKPDGWVTRVAAGRASQYHDTCMHVYDGTPFLWGVTVGTCLTPEFAFAKVVNEYPEALDSDGFYDPYNEDVEAYKRAYLLHHYYDPDLVNWRDISEVTPIDRLFTWGMMNSQYAGPIPLAPINLNRQYPAFDGVDNDLDGYADALTSVPILPGNLPGYFQSDRKAMGRYNLNEMPNPAAVAVSNIYLNTCPTLYIGRKPLKGYTSYWQLSSRSQYCRSESDTPYDKRIWYDNLFADCGSDHMHSNAHIQYQLDEIANTARAAHTGNSPVHSVYVTAQTVAQDAADSRILVPTSEVKIRATVERTWDGKVNFLEFNWIPRDGMF